MAKIHEEQKQGRFIKWWREGRGRNAEIIVQVWNNGVPNGEPDGDWAMPGAFTPNMAISQAIAQTPLKGA